MDSRSIGLLIVVAGLLAVIAGVLILSGALGWFGRLPGDFRWEGHSMRVYVPLTSMILLSLAISLVLYLLRRLF